MLLLTPPSARFCGCRLPREVDSATHAVRSLRFDLPARPALSRHLLVHAGFPASRTPAVALASWHSGSASTGENLPHTYPENDRARSGCLLFAGAEVEAADRHR